jgi:hypothetical protein
MTRETLVTCDWCERPVTGGVALMVVRAPKGDTVKRADLCLDCVGSLPGAEITSSAVKRVGRSRSKRTAPTGRQIAYAEKLANDVGDDIQVEVQINGKTISFEEMTEYIAQLAPPPRTDA